MSAIRTKNIAIKWWDVKIIEGTQRINDPSLVKWAIKDHQSHFENLVQKNYNLIGFLRRWLKPLRETVKRRLIKGWYIYNITYFNRLFCSSLN
jgi:hypothetical protein